MKTTAWLLLIYFYNSTVSGYGGDSVEPWNQTLSDVKVEHLKNELSFPWSKDPFLKASGKNSPATKPDPLVLGAVLYDANRPIALINGIAVEKGDRFENKRVVEVGRNYVVLEESDSLLELVIPPKAHVKAPEVRQDVQFGGSK